MTCDCARATLSGTAALASNAVPLRAIDDVGCPAVTRRRLAHRAVELEHGGDTPLLDQPSAVEIVCADAKRIVDRFDLRRMIDRLADQCRRDVRGQLLLKQIRRRDTLEDGGSQCKALRVHDAAQHRSHVAHRRVVQRECRVPPQPQAAERVVRADAQCEDALVERGRHVKRGAQRNGRAPFHLSTSYRSAHGRRLLSSISNMQSD